MEKTLALILALLCLLSGCLPHNDGSHATTLPGTTAAQPEETADPQPAQTTVPVTQPTEQTNSYTVKIPLADQSVFAEPSYDSNFAGIVGEAGVYTIVEEKVDDEGNLWGKLKSGMGWVDLTDVQETLESPPALTANFADRRLLESGEYHYRPAEEATYLQQIAFRAGEVLTDFCVATVETGDDGYIPDEVFYTLEQLTPEKPLVMDLSFPGDLSAYIVTFRDSNDARHCYLLSLSGRNGTVVLHPM